MPAQRINDYGVGGVKKLRDALNSSGGTPIERPFSRSARRALIDAIEFDIDGVPLVIHWVRTIRSADGQWQWGRDAPFFSNWQIPP